MIQHVPNPYYDETFFTFFVTLVQRMYAFLTFSESSLVADEIQILVLGGIGISCALLGTFLVLRKMTMLANSLSHTMLPGIVIAFLLQHLWSPQSEFDFSHGLPSGSLLIFAACAMAFLTTFFTETCVRLFRLQEDASIGIVFTFLFAVGVILVTALSKNAHVGAELMMGNVDALHKDDLNFVFWTLGINMLIFYALFRGFVITTFDPTFSAVIGISPGLFGYILMGLSAITSIAAFRAVGVLMFLAFLVTPTLIARLFTNSMNILLLLSIFVSVVISVAGVALSRHILTTTGFALSTAGIIVSMFFIVYMISFILVGISAKRKKKQVALEVM